MSRAARQLQELLSAVPQPDRGGPEKTASAPVDDSAEELVGISVALGNAYRDPILANLLESGEIRKFAGFSAGRYLSEATAQKVAHMAADDVRELAAHGLQLTHTQKTAEAERPRSAFKHLFKR